MNTVGRAMPQTEIKIASLETGETLPFGQQGEVCVRGYALMKGYDGDPEGTAQVIQPDGWLRTGDLGVMREDGCIHITGRSRDVIIRGGENIYPARGGGVSLHAPQGRRGAGGRDSQRAAGRDRRGVGAAAARRTEATEEEIKEFCQGQIAYYKIPEHVRFVDEFPATLSRQDSEVQDARVRDRSARLAGGGENGDCLNLPSIWARGDIALSQGENQNHHGSGYGAPKHGLVTGPRIATRYFTRFATRSSVAKSPTLRVNLISSPSILPV